MPDQARYDRYGWDYASVNPPEERALRWYRRHAAETGGPVLDVACGTGPLLSALASDGYEVVGLDLSETMLGEARRRLADLHPQAAARVRLVQGDMTAFDLPERFPLAIIADNSLREVESLDGMRTCLRCMRRHLRPDGRLLVVERRFDPSRYPGGVAEWPWTEPLVHPETGARLRRRIRVEVDEAARRLAGVMVYRTEHPDGSAEEETCPFEGPILAPADYHALFAEAGFTSQLHVGFEDREDDGVEPMLCFVLRVV